MDNSSIMPDFSTLAPIFVSKAIFLRYTIYVKISFKEEA